MKVPAFLGSSFAFLGGFSTIAALDTGIYANMSANDKAAYACGGVVVAGLMYLILVAIIKLIGVNRVMRFLPPVVTGPVIICIGLSLAGSAINNASTNWFLALIALSVIIIFNIWGKGMFKIIPILMGVVISYAVALLMNTMGMTNPDGSAILDFTSVAASGFIGLPTFQLCKFDITAVLVMAPIAIATMMEHVGDMSAISATVGENFIADPGRYEYRSRKAAEEAAHQLVLYGNVDLREVSLAFKNSDRISDILVEEGDAVKKGQVLAKLDTADLEHRMDITRSQVDAQQAVVDKLHNGTREEDLRSAEAKVREARAEKDFLTSDYQRKQDAFQASGGKSVSRQVLEDARTKLQVAEAKVNEAEEAQNLAVAGPRSEDVAAGEAQLDALKNTLKQEEYTLSQSELTAPQDGVIRSRLMEVGDMASPQKPVFRMSLNTKKWVRVYVKEGDLGKIHEGMDARVYTDSDPKNPVKGQIGYISSTAEFTPKNVETSELRTALLYEVRVYVTDPENRLRMGMPATVKIGL